MSTDRSDLRVYVHACPEDQREALAAYFADSGRLFHLDWNDNEPLPEALELDRPYTVADTYYSALEDIAAELREVAPGAAFLAWSDPDGGDPGELIAFAPELGAYTANCDGSGDPVLSRSAITELIDRAGGNPGRAKAAVYAAMGGPWFDYFADCVRREAAR